MNVNDDLYVALLSEARDGLKKRNGTTTQEFYSRLEKANVNVRQARLFEKICDVDPFAPSNVRHHMNLEAYMQLLEYEELQHSLEESRRARKEAKRAIQLAIVAIVVQIVLWLLDKSNLVDWPRDIQLSGFFESVASGVVANVVFTIALIYVVQQVRYWFFLRLKFHNTQFDIYYKAFPETAVLRAWCKVSGLTQCPP